MKEIPLSQSRVTTVDDADYPYLMQWKWSCLNHPDGRCYAVRMNPGTRRLIRMHRVIVDAPAERDVDHVDGNGLNNTRANLRACTETENMHNRRKIKAASSQFKGIYLYRGKWTARITVNYKTLYLGYFASELDAARAYNRAALEHFGAFARLNEV